MNSLLRKLFEYNVYLVVEGWFINILMVGMCIEDGCPYRVLGSFYSSILEHYRAVPLQPKQADAEIR